MLTGTRDILVNSTLQDLQNYEKLLGDGSQFGIKLSYREQSSPDGLAQAFIIGEKFIGDDCFAMVFSDNIFYGNEFRPMLRAASENVKNGGYYFRILCS